MGKAAIFAQVGPGDDYRLSVSGYNQSQSTLGDSLTGGQNINGMKFSTRYSNFHVDMRRSQIL